MSETNVGFKDRLNLYNCAKCGNTIITIDVDDGVTPFMLVCKKHGGCSDGMMTSSMYNVPPMYTPSHEWYKPAIGTSDADSDHVKQGGLILRKRETPNRPFEEIQKERMFNLGKTLSKQRKDEKY